MSNSSSLGPRSLDSVRADTVKHTHPAVDLLLFDCQVRDWAHIPRSPDGVGGVPS
jgi:hypothetical protein